MALLDLFSFLGALLRSDLLELLEQRMRALKRVVRARLLLLLRQVRKELAQREQRLRLV